MVDDVAQFSVRGGIFDIYSFGMAEPVRLEFWGDEISELRHFDLISQRSTRDADLALILPVDGQMTGSLEDEERVSITTLFAPDTIVVVPEDSRALAAEFASRGVEFWKPVHTNSDNLRGFEVQDVDGYVLYFGKPLLD